MCDCGQRQRTAFGHFGPIPVMFPLPLMRFAFSFEHDVIGGLITSCCPFTRIVKVDHHVMRSLAQANEAARPVEA